MKNPVLVILFFASIALQAQITTLTPPYLRKNNIKITVVNVGEGFLNIPFSINGYHIYRFQYERLLKGRHTITVKPTYSFSKNNFNNIQYIGQGFSLGLGYRYYLYQWAKNKSFNGVYGGVGVSGGSGVLREYLNGERVLSWHTNSLGTDLRFGIQTTFFKRFSVEVEQGYYIGKYHYLNYYRTQRGFTTSLRIGYTF